MPGEVDETMFAQTVRATITRKLERLGSEELVYVLGFLVSRERRSSATEEPEGLYPIL